MRPAIFALVVLFGLSHGMPQELGAGVESAAGEATPAEAAPVEAAAEVEQAAQDVNRQGLAGGVNIAATAEGAAGGAGDAGAGASASAGADAGANAGAGDAGAGAGDSAAATNQCANRNPYGCAFYGPGLNNPAAVAPNPANIKTAQEILTDPTNLNAPNLRVRVMTGGELFFTNQYGQDVELLDQFELGPFDPVDPTELGELQIVGRQGYALNKINQCSAAAYTEAGLTADGSALLPGTATTGPAADKFLKRRFTVIPFQA